MCRAPALLQHRLTHHLPALSDVRHQDLVGPHYTPALHIPLLPLLPPFLMGQTFYRSNALTGRVCGFAGVLPLLHAA